MIARTVVTLLLWSSCLIPYSLAAETRGYFDGNAYAKYLLHRRPVNGSSNTIQMSFRTVQPNGLLLYGDSTGDEFGDYFTLELVGGKLRFALRFGRHQDIDDMKNITIGDDLADNKYHTVVIEHNGHETWVKLVDTTTKVEKHRRIETHNKELYLDDVFFIGGAHDFRMLRDIISGVNFKGCIKGVRFNERKLLQSLGGNATILRKYEVKDFCPDVIYNPITLNGRSSQFSTSINPRSNELKGRLKFRTYKSKGTLLSQTKAGGKGFELSYQAEAVELKVYIKNNSTTVTVSQVFKYRSVDNGMWHDIDFEISAARIFLSVNNVNDTKSPGSEFPQHFFTGSVLVGAGDFIGCIWDLTLNGAKFDPNTQKNNPNIQLNVCNIYDFCFPNACKNFGQCSQDGKGFSCDCNRTDYKGSVCQLPKYYRTCYEIRQQYIDMATGNYTIDPDGPGPEKPFQTSCSIKTELDWFGDEISRVWTEVKSMDYNVMLQKYPPEEARKPESVIRDVVYKPSFYSAQTVAMASEYCHQFVQYMCMNSKLLNNLNPAYGHWVGSHGKHFYYWGGATPDDPGKCVCALRGDCLDSNKGCNCDAGLDTLESDEGYLSGANGLTLPVSKVLFGDVDNDNAHYANYTVGSLYCYGRANNTATFRREDGIITLQDREGTLDGDNGYISLYFRTPYDRGILFHQGDKTNNTEEFIRLAITSNDTLMLTFDIGNGHRSIIIQSRKREFNTNRFWHSVVVWHNIKEFGLRVDGIEQVISNPLQSNKQLDVVGNLYIGGYMEDLMEGFVGCIRGLTINGRIIDLVKLAKETDYVNTGCEGSCAKQNECQGGARCIDDYNIYRCDCHITPFYGYFCEKDWGASFKEQKSYLNYTWPTAQKDVMGTDIAVGFRTARCSGTIMTMKGDDPNYFFMISIEVGDRLRFSFKHGVSTEGAKEIKPPAGKSFCDNKRHTLSFERMLDKIVYKVDGGSEIREFIPRLYRAFKQPKSIVIGDIGRGGFEGCISGVKITNWLNEGVRLPTVEPIKWSEYDFTHTKDIKKVGIARDKCGPEPKVPTIPTRPIPGRHGSTTATPVPTGRPGKADTQGYFDGNAYAKYLLHRRPVNGSRNTIQLSFRTVQPNGLLLYGDSTGDEFGDYFTLELVGGKLRFALGFGRHQGIDDIKNITLGDELADNRYHTVVIEHNGHETWVKLDTSTKGEKHRRIETRYKELYLDDIFFIGGAHDFRRLRDIISGANFKGCIKGVRFNKRKLLQSLGGNAIILRKYGVKDICPDVVYSPITLNGRSSQFSTSINHMSNELKGRLKFRTYKSKGTLLSQTKAGGKGFELSYQAEAVELKVYIKDNSTTVTVSQVFKYRSVDNGMWHDIDFEISAARIFLSVNNVNDTKSPGSEFPQHFFTGSVLVGAGDFIGCIWDLTLNGAKFDPNTQKNNPNIQLNVCNIYDFCFPNACKNFGQCSQDGKGFSCDCNRTDYKGSVCQLPKYYRTCYEIRQQYIDMATGNYTIDPDGPGPEKPFQTSCSIKTELDWFGDEISRVWTEVKSMDYNVMLQKYPPEEARKPESVIRDVVYKPSIYSAQTVAMASEYCHQFVQYMCMNSKLLNNLNPAYGHWVGSHGKHFYYWGGATPDDPGKCVCALRGDCLDSNKGCNCDAGLDTLESDEGYLSGANGLTLPVSKVLFGDVDNDNAHYANYTVGSLYCYGRANNTATFRREDGIITLQDREGTLDGDNGYISLYFRTPYDRGILFHQGDKTNNTEDFIRLAITSNDTLMLSFDIGNGPRSITIQSRKREFNTNRFWHSVVVWHNIKEFGLRVDGIEQVISNPLQSNKQLDAVGNLYFGGYMKDLMEGFVGCIRGLTINGRIIDLVKLAKETDYVNPGCEGSCAKQNECQGGARCIDDYNIYRCDCHITPFYGYFCEKDWGASFKEQKSYLNYTWPTAQKDVMGTDIAVGFRTARCSGTIMTMKGDDPNYFFMISIEVGDRLRFSFKHGVSTEGAKVIKPPAGKSFCDNKRHTLSFERMLDKIVYKVDGGSEIREFIPRLYRAFKQPKSIVIGDIGRGGFEGCISGVKITNWLNEGVRLPTVEPIKWSEYDFTHTKDIKKVGIARDKCGPEPKVPTIPTRPIPGRHGSTTPTPVPTGRPGKGKGNVADKNTVLPPTK